MIRKQGCFLLLFYAITVNVLAQDIDAALVNWMGKKPVEKIYVQFDNRVYLPGQTIWYKAYLTMNQLPSALSTNLYIDWFNTHGKIVGHTIAPIINGTAAGNFNIPENIAGGNLKAVAYTKWMKNFDSCFFFQKNLFIATEKVQTDKKVSPEITIQFLPESGHAIIGVNGNMAFKAINQLGLPENIVGVVKNTAGKVIANFQSTHHGMGAFKYKPEARERYTAEWTDALGTQHQTILPNAEKEGVSLLLEGGSLDRYFNINRSDEVPEAWKKITVIAESQGEILFKATVNLTSKTSIRSKLPVFQFPSGIAQLILFDQNLQPLCERQLMINNQEYVLKATVSTDTLNFEKKGKNVFEISVHDTTVTNLSLSITDGNMNGISDNNIVSQLLLTSDLRGHVFNPAYYFSSDADSIAAQLDLVMLTNGWRKYNWSQVFSQEPSKQVFLRDSTYLTLSGKLRDLSIAKTKKAEAIELIIVSKDSAKSIMSMPVDADGNFVQTNLIMFDIAKIYYKLKGLPNIDNKNISVWNNIQLPDSNRMIATTNFDIDSSGNGILKMMEAASKRLIELKSTTTLKEVVVHSIAKTPMKELDEKYSNGLFTGTNAYQFDLTNDFVAGFGNALTYLQGKIPGLTITSPSFSQNARLSWRGFPVLLFLNEFKVDQEQLLSITMSDVAYIKVFRPPFMGTFASGGSGAIAVYTKKGVDASRSIKGLDYLEWSGYSPIKEFYSPNYAEQQASLNEVDTRKTLEWYPTIITDKENQHRKIIFYNNDFSKTLHLILEGMDKEGRLVHFCKLLQ